MEELQTVCGATVDAWGPQVPPRATSLAAQQHLFSQTLCLWSNIEKTLLHPGRVPAAAGRLAHVTARHRQGGQETHGCHFCPEAVERQRRGQLRVCSEALGAVSPHLLGDWGSRCSIAFRRLGRGFSLCFSSGFEAGRGRRSGRAEGAEGWPGRESGRTFGCCLPGPARTEGGRQWVGPWRLSLQCFVRFRVCSPL